MRSRVEASSEPTGAHSPFERHVITVSTPSVSVAGATPSATAAFQMRAPSRWTRKPHSLAAATTARSSATSCTVPPPRLWLFSSTTSDTSEV